MVLVNASPIAVETSSSKSSSKSKFSFFSSGSSKSNKSINSAQSVQDLSVSSSQSAHTSSPNLAHQHQQPTPSENSSALVDSNGKDSGHRYVSQVKSSESGNRQLQHPSPPITKSQSVSTLVSDNISAGGQHHHQEESAAKLALGSPSSTTGHSAHPQLPSKSSQLKSVNMPLSAEETQLHCKWHSHFFFPRFTFFLCLLSSFASCCRCRTLAATFLICLLRCVFFARQSGHFARH